VDLGFRGRIVPSWRMPGEFAPAVGAGSASDEVKGLGIGDTRYHCQGSRTSRAQSRQKEKKVMQLIARAGGDKESSPVLRPKKKGGDAEIPFAVRRKRA